MASPISQRKLSIPAQNWLKHRASLSRSQRDTDDDTIAEAQNQAACNDSREQRRENLRHRRNESLQEILVLLCHVLDRVFGYPLNPAVLTNSL